MTQAEYITAVLGEIDQAYISETLDFLQETADKKKQAGKTLLVLAVTMIAVKGIFSYRDYGKRLSLKN